DLNGEPVSASHQISNVSIGPDGKLYVHNGESFIPADARNLNSYRGKVLRVNLDGSVPTDNPYYDASDGITAKDKIWASGFRNPFAGAWRPSEGAQYIPENGPTLDRITRLVKGRDYGWDGTGASFTNYAIYNWVPAHAPINADFVDPTKFNGS